MSGIKALRKIQMGKETTAGTIVAATTLWRGTGTAEDALEWKQPKEDIGYLSDVDRSYIPKLLAKLKLDSVEATFEQLPHVLEMGIKAATPVQDGSGSGYIRSYILPTTQPNTIKTYTLEVGDNQQEEVMEYVHATDFTLDAKAGESWMISANLVGRQLAKGTYTTPIAIPTVEEILFGGTKIYLDNVSGTFGSTLKSNTLLDASLTYKTGIIEKFTADGYKYFSFLQYTPPSAILKLTFEHDGTSVAEKDNWRNQTARLIRLLAQGSQFTTAGSTYSYKTMILDLAGKWSKFNAIGDQNGNDIIEAEFTAGYDPTKADFGKIMVVNALSVLP